MKTLFGKRVPNCVKREHVDYCVNCGDLVFPEEMDLHEDPKKWFKQKWVPWDPMVRSWSRGGSEQVKESLCLLQAKAYAMGKKKRKTSVLQAKKRSNADRRGKAKNVKT